MLLLRHAFDPRQHAGDLPPDELTADAVAHSSGAGHWLASHGVRSNASGKQSDRSNTGPVLTPDPGTVAGWAGPRRHSWGSWSGERSEFRKRITKFPVRGTGSEKTQIDVLLAPCLPRENSPEPRLAHL